MRSMFWEFFVIGLLLYGLAVLALPFLIRERQPLAVTPNVERKWGGPHPRLITAVRTSRIRPNMRSAATASGCPNRRIRGAPRVQRRYR